MRGKNAEKGQKLIKTSFFLRKSLTFRVKELYFGYNEAVPLPRCKGAKPSKNGFGVFWA